MGTLVLFHPVTVLSRRGEFNKEVTTAAESINKTTTIIIVYILKEVRFSHWSMC